ncbi:hypothetical protein I6A84_20805 [Frankia sp. CNm7]|uniref:Uncharacterized protein n=1 Tax=Frankia nepalensis TaxID=1836974 RepID=A0A937RJ91_9ACTN|nr:hypothetical protein [Frankia nepalensis]MBL7495651.1 hypothetical protein [Frankia nepalensis]MBL7510283.1 hypothetical protein [Frankia nepalensis]MBL7520461.1 hypothetical protein [Frankia nepalensis]MBL7631192.1 hypothetical protein [Frankia nepalensis]
MGQQLAVDAAARAEAAARMRRAARGLRAFDVDTFTLDGAGPGLARDPAPDSEGDRALVAAGALVTACTSLVDHLVDDIATLLTTGAATAYDAAAKGYSLGALDRLPPAYDDHYTAYFAKKLLVATVSVTGRLAEPDWIPMACLAEQLALYLLVEQAAGLLEYYGLDDDPRARYQYFEETAFENNAHLRLYDQPSPVIDYGAHPAAAPINAWFTPFYDGFYVHPYVEPRS